MLANLWAEATHKGVREIFEEEWFVGAARAPAAKRQRYAGIDVKAEAAVAQAGVKVERAPVVKVERSIIDEFQRTAVADAVQHISDADDI